MPDHHPPLAGNVAVITGGSSGIGAAAAPPLRRIASVDDIASAILACATTLTFSTGSVIQVDGGRHL